MARVKAGARNGRSGRSTVVRGAVALAALCVVTALLLAPPSGAATPGSGTIDQTTTTASWTGPTQSAITQDQTHCSDPGAFCDHFHLIVAATVNGSATVAVTWGAPSDDFDLFVYSDSAETSEVTHSAGSAGTSEQATIPNASGNYYVKVVYFAVLNSSYSGTATFLKAKTGGGTTFSTTPLAFGSSAVVSPTFIAGEPQTTMERATAAADPGAIDNRRVYVDWPLSSRTEIGQLSRSTDGGKTFRLLLDMSCAQRNRPDCTIGGGGDTEEDVNAKNGNLFFADQEVLANEALASSTDHGDSFPVTRQHALSNGATGVDRQWLAATDSTSTVGPLTIESFFSYHVPAVGEYVQGIDQNGTVIATPATQIPNVGQSGQLRVDNSASSPGHGWIYQPYRDLNGAYFVATADSSNPTWETQAGWQENQVTTDQPTVFPWLALDSSGNAYAVWITGGVMFYSFSPIRDKTNDPGQGGRPGTFWSPEAQVSLPGLNSTVFPEAIGGRGGTFGITYTGTDQCGTGGPQLSDNCPNDTHWNEYGAVIRGALQKGSPAVVSTGVVSHRFIHRGNVCTSGTTCLTTGKDRSLLDMNDVGVDAGGHLGIVYGNNFSTFGDVSETTGAGADESAFVYFAKETGGPLLFGGSASSPARAPEGKVVDPAGDGTWPNIAGGTNLPSLDLRAVTFTRTSGGKLVVALGLQDPTTAGMARDLAAWNTISTTPPSTQGAAARLQYVVRFETATDVYHVDMEFSPSDPGACTCTFFGGRLDTNDKIPNGTPMGANVAATYNPDPGVTATGTLNGNQWQLKVSLAALGIGPTESIYSVAAFAMAGPAQADQTLLDPMRTVDASPPFDVS